MKTAILNFLCLTFILTVTPGFAADSGAEKLISHSFAVEPGGELTVDADLGDIQVVTGDISTVEVSVERDVQGASASKTASMLKGHKVVFSTNDNNVYIEAATAKKSRRSTSQIRLGVRFRITVPRRFNVSLNTGGGAIQVSDLNGTVDAHSSGGNLVFEKIQGAVDAHTSSGSISIALDQQLTGDSYFRSGGGDITAKMPESTALNLVATTDAGKVSSEIPVATEGAQKEGALTGKMNGGGVTLVLKTSAGNITVVKE